MARVSLLLAAPLVLVVALSGCAAKNDIDLTDNQFAVAQKTVAAGTTLTFDNEGSNLHNVRIHKLGTDGNTTLLDKDIQHSQEVEFTFSSAGTYHVWCKYHGQMTSGMHMLVTVT